MFTITIQCATAEEGITILAKLRGAETAVGAGLATTQAETNKGKGATGKGAAASTGQNAASSPTAPAQEQQKPDAAQGTKPPATSAGSTEDPYKPVGAAITAAVAINKPAVVEVLAKFGAKTGKELKPAQYDDFVAALAAKLEGGDELS